MPAKQPYYITTAISYPNGPPHIGHAYEVIATDAIARFMRLDGYDVYFLTGTDEHGQKMQQTAAREGITPRELLDRNVPQFRGDGRAARTARTTTSSAPPRSGITASSAGNLGSGWSRTATSISTNMPAGTRCATRPITPRTRRS